MQPLYLIALAIIITSVFYSVKDHTESNRKMKDYFKGYHQLSATEKQILYYFIWLPNSSIWNGNGWQQTIVSVVNNGDAYQLRELLKQLKSEGEANPEGMKKIVGAEVWECLN